MTESVIIYVSSALMLILIIGSIAIRSLLKTRALFYLKIYSIVFSFFFPALIGIMDTQLYQRTNTLYEGVGAALVCLAGWLLSLALFVLYFSIDYCISENTRNKSLISKVFRVILYISWAFILFELSNNFLHLGISAPTVFPICYVFLYFLLNIRKRL